MGRDDNSVIARAENPKQSSLYLWIASSFHSSQ